MDDFFELLGFLFVVGLFLLPAWGVVWVFQDIEKRAEKNREEILQAKYLCQEAGGVYIKTSNFSAQCFQKQLLDQPQQ